MSPLLLGFLCLLLFAGQVAVVASDDDREVLVELKRFLQANNRFNRGEYDRWPESDASPCRWAGVTCDGRGRVTALDLSGSAISGAAFGNFSRLTALTWLDLSDNGIGGELPAGDLAQCRGLVHLNLSHNLIAGGLDVSGLTKLRTLDVSGNRFVGGAAASFVPAACGDLAVLNVSGNGFTGDITGLFDGCPKLEYIDLSTNNFTGELWPGIARFTQFNVAENNLTGGVPAATFPGGCKLRSLDLSANHFAGEFPDSIASCSNLTYLSLWGNGFAGKISAGIGELAGLETLILGKNRFDRRIPPELTNCTSLQFLDMSTNAFGGDMQGILGEFVTLKYLVLHHNNYTGGIVSSGVLRLPLLARLDLSFNQFSGELPLEVADMKSLKYLMLPANSFSGGIPPEYGRLAELQALDLSYNGLTGRIPASIGNLTSLLWLMLAGNQLSGEIPPEIGNCSSLLWLNLADNRLTGRIPPEMAEIGRNPAPTFEKNRKDVSVLAGSGECQAMRRWIPATYPPFNFVYTVMTRENCRSIWDRLLKGYGIIPICTNSSSPVRSNTISGYVQLSGNKLSGEIPSQIGAMRNLSLLHLDNNQLTGRLPPAISHLPLVVLNVSNNSISGGIPPEIGHILCLEILDLTYNNFSGELPASLGNLTGLNKFNVSYNPLLSGDVPTTGQLGTFDELSFLGDPLITLQDRGPRRQRAPQAAIRGRGMSPRTIALWFVFSLIIAFIAGTVVFIMANLRARFPVDQDPDPESLSCENPKQVRRVPYVGHVVAAVRVFRAEMEVLADRMGFTWPHPNLVTLYGWCLAGSAKILVYEYLDGGNLESLIGDHAAFGRRRRLDAAIGVARALVFLHHECRPAVVHRDVKASNVLLGRDGGVKVTDFGLARVVRPGDTHVSTMVAGTVGYVAPEYGQTWRATTKGDVYSYGVLLMELATGRRAVDGGEEECLVEWSRRMAQEGWPAREAAASSGAVLWDMLMLGMRCTADSPQERPDMPDVLAALLDIAGSGGGGE
uniref:non-specific serine/threonine protein kinase n=1 Tax=Oryza rufipogon TaxID=4529 RepID=A0A0E0QAS4_ORYRU